MNWNDSVTVIRTYLKNKV